MGKVLPSQRLLKQFEEQLVFVEMNLSEIVRSGAQMMLQYALEREVTEALGRNYYENAPATTKEKGRRNGYESHRVLTGEGAVTVQVPRVRETEKVFQSKILDAYVSRTEKLDELIARMYVHGMSTRDIEATFADVLSGTGVSKSVVSRVTRCLSEDFEAFRKRDHLDGIGRIVFAAREHLYQQRLAELTLHALRSVGAAARRTIHGLRDPPGSGLIVAY